LALINLKQLLGHAAEKNLNYAKQVKIIYDVSLTSENSDALISMENIDGGLVGRCSIDPQSFIKLCHVDNQLNFGEKV
jgi:triosephosphate isomerase